jgi:hypothetical protein
MQGNVGIGITAPTAKLHVIDGASSTGIAGVTTAGWGVLGEATNGSGLYGYATSGKAIEAVATTGTGLKVTITGSGKAATFMGGKVGIGTSTPGKTFDVIGEARISDSLKVQNIVYGTYRIPVSEGTPNGSNGDILILQASTTICFGTIVYINSDGKAAPCNASSISTCPYAFAIATEAMTANQMGRFLIRGTIWQEDWEYAIGAKVYVGSGCPNIGFSGMSNSNNVNMPVGFMMNQNILFFTGNMNSLEHL